MNWIVLALLLLFAFSADAQGVDCTGITDSAKNLQAIIDNNPDSSTFAFPPMCKLKLSSSITILNRTGLRFTAASDGRTSKGALINWTGNADCGICVRSSEYISFEGFLFQCNGILHTMIDFDGDPTEQHIGTAPSVVHSSFQPCHPPFDKTYKAISVSNTATSNWENGYFDFNSFGCQSTTRLRARDASIVQGSNVLMSAGSNFVASDVGLRVRVTYNPKGPYSNGILDTNIASVTDSQHVVMADSATSTQDGATVHTGESYGVGIYIGNSLNAKHHKIYNSAIDHCEFGIRVVGGSAEIRHIGGYSNDTAVSVGCSVVESSLIDFMETESDMIGISACGTVPVDIAHARLSVGSAVANGFFQIDGKVTIRNATLQLDTGHCSDIPTNAVVVGFGGSSRVTSLGSLWRCPYAAIGFNAPVDYKFGIPPTTINDGFEDNLDAPHNFGCFIDAPSCVKITSEFGGSQGNGIEVISKNLNNLPFSGGPILLHNLPISDPHMVGQVWNNGGVLSVSGG